MATTTKEQGVWDLDEVYNKINVGGIWVYNEQRQAFSWGEQDFGELGVNTSGSRYSSPKQVGTDGDWSAFGNRGPGANKTSALWIKSDGTAWMAGINAYGVLGLNQPGPSSSPTRYSSPVQIGTDTTWSTAQGKATGVAGGSKIAIKTDGSLWQWGRQSYGVIVNSPDPNYGHRSSPVQVPGTTWENVSCSTGPGDASTIVTKSDGSIWVWGRNVSGELGQNAPTNSHKSSPVQVPSPGPGTTTWQTEEGKFCGGDSNRYAINTDNELWCWGENERGALGQNQGGPSAHYSSPVQIPGAWTWITGGGPGGGAMGIKTDGTAWSWGFNNYGQTGLNTGTAISSPTQLPGTWDRLLMGPWASYGFQGTDLYAWGPNSNGILGQNGGTNYSSPVQIPGAWADVTNAAEAVWATKIAGAS